MRRFYVTTKEAWLGSSERDGNTFRHIDLFHPAVGSHYIDLPDGMILLSTDFATETTEAIWHAHPEVARLPHPIYESGVKLNDLHQKAEHAHKQFRAHHLAALAAIGITGEHTIFDVHRIASAINPLVKLSSTT
jgi:hypothetical protein